MHVITLDDFWSFFRLTNARKLTHSDTCSRSEPSLGLHHLKRPPFSYLSSTPPPPKTSVLMALSSRVPTPHRAFFFFFNLTPSCCSKHSHCLYLLSLCKSIYFSLISVYSTAPSQHTASKHLLNETKLEPAQYTSQD